MIFNLNKIDRNSAFEYDVCVIGSGPAGISLAQNLAQNKNIKICVLEGGGEEFEDDSYNIYQGETKGLNYNIQHHRLRYFGGTSNHWAGYCIRPPESDFTQEGRIWPVSYAEISPYFSEAEKILELNSNNWSVNNFLNQEKGNKIKFKDSEISSLLVNFSKPLRFGEKYKKQFESDKNLDLFLNANLYDLVLHENLKTIKIAKVKTLSGKKFEFKAKYFVLACGGIENARLLLNFNNQISQGIGNQNNLVGKYFMEHLLLTSGNTAIKAIFSSTNKWEEFYNYRSNEESLLCLQIADDLIRKNNLLSCFFEIYAKWKPDNIGMALTEINQKLTANNQHNHLSVVVNFEQLPKESNKVTLADEKCALGLRKTKLFLKMHDEDKQSIKKTIMLFANIMGANSAGFIKLEQWFLDGNYEGKITGGSHHMGSTRMSDSEKTGVVDKNCKLYGTDNLYIAGSSIFPYGTLKTPTYNIVAFSLRLADHIKKLLKI